LDRSYYKLSNVHILSQTPTFTTSRRHHNAEASATMTKIILSDVAIRLNIINMKTKAALEAANKRLSTTITLFVMRSFTAMLPHEKCASRAANH
jgi:hypothetical protein